MGVQQNVGPADVQLPAYVQLSGDLEDFSTLSGNDVLDALDDYLREILHQKTEGHSDLAPDMIGPLKVMIHEEHGRTTVYNPEYCAPLAESVPTTVLQTQKHETVLQTQNHESYQVPDNEQKAQWHSQNGCGKAGRKARGQEKGNDAQLETALRQALQRIAGHPKVLNDWWRKRSAAEFLLCPLTGFPICLLPYPPFKLQEGMDKFSPRRFVDGKVLAMRCIVTGQLEGKFAACGQELGTFDMRALDAYVSRCKLGPYRPSYAATLAEEAKNGATVEERKKASQKLARLIAQVQCDLVKLQRIQKNRLQKIVHDLPPHMQAKMWHLQQSSSVIPFIE